MSAVKDARESLTHCVVVITNVPEMNQASLQRGDRAVVIQDDMGQNGLVIVEMLNAPKYRVWLSRQNFELAPVEEKSVLAMSTPIDERQQAAAIADRLLDEPYADPDDDIRVLARQFNRSQEQVERFRSALEKIIPLRGPGGDIAFIALHGTHK